MPRSSPVHPLPAHWFQILLSVSGEAEHGLAIVRQVYERTSGRVHLWPGMLYGSLKRMAQEGLVTEVAPPIHAASMTGRPRFYQITARGRRVCAAEVAQLERYVAAARANRRRATGRR